MPDLLVVIPGIMGSTLELDGVEVWGPSLGAITRNLVSLGRNLERLKVPTDLGDQDPEDGVSATRLMPTLHMLPSFWGIDGYGTMIDFLSARFTVSAPTNEQPGNLLLFPYDWRLSNALSAERLASKALPELERWREHSGNPDAKLILICHSMGGLVARWFLEVLGGKESTRHLITIGTPYQGAVKALSTLVNGVSKGVGPLSLDLTDLARSFPSIYQLLPTYPCLDVGGGRMQKLQAASIPSLDADRLNGAADFHETIAENVSPRAMDYEITAVVGVSQPTPQSALLAGSEVVANYSYGGKDLGGDGSVPRPSARPPEWGDDSRATFPTQQHAVLQSTTSVLDQLFGVLTSGVLDTWMGGRSIGVELPDVIAMGETLRIQVRATQGETNLALRASVTQEDGTRIDTNLLTNVGDGEYLADFDGLPPGSCRVTIESAVPHVPVEPVTAFSLVWDQSALEV